MSDDLEQRLRRSLGRVAGTVPDAGQQVGVGVEVGVRPRRAVWLAAAIVLVAAGAATSSFLGRSGSEERRVEAAQEAATAPMIADSVQEVEATEGASLKGLAEAGAWLVVDDYGIARICETIDDTTWQDPSRCGSPVEPPPGTPERSAWRYEVGTDDSAEAGDQIVAWGLPVDGNELLLLCGDIGLPVNFRWTCRDVRGWVALDGLRAEAPLTELGIRTETTRRPMGPYRWQLADDGYLVSNYGQIPDWLPPSQTQQDAARDGVVPELAALPLAVRADAVVVSSEGNLAGPVVARPSDLLREQSVDDGCAWGDTAGEYPVDFICTLEYAEVLFLDEQGNVERAYPMPGTSVAEMASRHEGRFWVFERSGDRALPDHIILAVDTETWASAAVVIPHDPSGPSTTYLPHWEILTAADGAPLIGGTQRARDARMEFLVRRLDAAAARATDG